MKPYDLVSAIFKEGMVRKFFSAQFREKSGKYFFWLFFFFSPHRSLRTDTEQFKDRRQPQAVHLKHEDKDDLGRKHHV